MRNFLKMQLSTDNLFTKIAVTVLFTFSFACSKKGVESAGKIDGKEIPTVRATNLEVADYTDAGLRILKADVMERYELIDSPYILFPRGVYLEIFNDSTGLLESMLEGDYAHYNEKLKLWEARGNVVARNAEGKVLKTEQLFMDEAKKLIYSNVKSRIIDGEEVTVGSGFEADDKLENITITQTMGRILVDTTKTIKPDTLSADSVEIDAEIQPNLE